MRTDLAARDVWQPWFRWTTAGEFAGFLTPVLVVHNGDRLNRLPLAAVLPIAAVAGTGVLLSLGTAQWFVLRTRFPHAHLWIWANALAWAAGLLVFAAVTTPLWQPGQPTGLVVLIGALGGLLMAATTAAVTGAALARLARRN